MTIRPRAAALAILALGATTVAASADGPLARHRCEIVSRLRRIHEAGPRDTSRNRFVVVALKGRPQSYVQCIFMPSDTRMLCEASSGAYGDRHEDASHPSDDAVAALAGLGFVRRDAAKNFEREIALGTPPDLGAAADLILAALSQGYGAEASSQIEITAPKAKGFDGRCTPLASLE